MTPPRLVLDTHVVAAVGRMLRPLRTYVPDIPAPASVCPADCADSREGRPIEAEPIPGGPGASRPERVELRALVPSSMETFMNPSAFHSAPAIREFPLSRPRWRPKTAPTEKEHQHRRRGCNVHDFDSVPFRCDRRSY